MPMQNTQYNTSYNNKFTFDANLFRDLGTTKSDVAKHTLNK
jgi:hypothetical protein